jgi:hypothetical protein
VREGRGTPARLIRLDLETGRRTLWKDLAPADPAGLQGITSIAITPDGQTCAYSVGRTLSQLYLVEGLK